MLSDVKIFMTEKCNMRCDYCFVDKSKGRSMTADTLKKTIDFTIENANQKADITFFGGEPLIEIDNIKLAVEYIKENYCSFNANYILNTNMTLLDHKTVKFLEDNCFTVLYSIDGTGQTHDNHRKDILGKETFNKVLDKIKILTKSTLKSVCKIVLTPETVGQAYESIQFMDSCRIKYVYLDLARQLNWTAMDLECFEAQYKLIAGWLPGRYTKITNLLGARHIESSCGVGNHQLAVSVTGDIYPCYRLLYDELMLGNVFNGINLTNQEHFKNKLICLNSCIYNEATMCTELCPAVNLETNKDIVQKSAIDCEFHKISNRVKKIYMHNIVHSIISKKV